MVYTGEFKSQCHLQLTSSVSWDMWLYLLACFPTCEMGLVSICVPERAAWDKVPHTVLTHSRLTVCGPPSIMAYGRIQKARYLPLPSRSV